MWLLFGCVVPAGGVVLVVAELLMVLVLVWGCGYWGCDVVCVVVLNVSFSSSVVLFGCVCGAFMISVCVLFDCLVECCCFDCE